MQLPKPGDRIRLVHMNDPYGIESGAEGTVKFANEFQISVDWDNGRGLMLAPDEDVYFVIEES